MVPEKDARDNQIAASATEVKDLVDCQPEIDWGGWHELERAANPGATEHAPKKSDRDS